jgi:hypothetical protein
MSGFADATAAIERPDVILTDEIAIRGDPVGFRQVRCRFPDAVIVALVAPFRRRSGPLDGVQCTIEKPINDSCLLLAFEWALEIRDASRSAGPKASASKARTLTLRMAAD